MIDMANATFDIKEIRTEAQRGLHAGVGAADLAIEAVRDYVAEAQKRVELYQKDAQGVIASAQSSARDFDARTFPAQVAGAFRSRVGELSEDAKARRDAAEKRIAELQSEAGKFLVSNVETASSTYAELVQRGEKVVKRFRKETAAVADPGPVKKSTGETTTAKKSTTRTAKKAPAKKATTRKPAAKKATATK